MISLLLIQDSMVWISFQLRCIYIESFCLGNWTRFIKFAQSHIPLSSSILLIIGCPSHSCSPNLVIYLVVHDTPPNVCCVSDSTPPCVCVFYFCFYLCYNRLGHLLLCSSHHATFVLVQSLPWITIQRQQNKNSRNGRKGRHERRYRKGL
jgi:hypothetical protein